MAAVHAGHNMPLTSSTGSERKRRQYTHFKKDVKSTKVWVEAEAGGLPPLLDRRYVDVKKRLVKPEHYAALQASWDRLQIALQQKAEEIAAVGPNVQCYLSLNI